MELQTTVQIPAPAFNISHATRLLLLGSCFAENIGEKFRRYKFNADVNPCGIIYNPASVAGSLRLLLSGKRFTPDDLLPVGGQWVSLQHHGSFSSPDPDTCLHHINTRLDDARRELPRLDLLVITWGTAWVYRHISRSIIVSNCHKIPAREFERYRLSVEDIVTDYTHLLHELLQANPTLQVLFTVSPIRHWKDGAHGNQLSKATLLLAIDALRQRFPNVHYFPSYEIVLDELRDYRYYADDMLHLTPLAVNYIWERFSTTYFTPATIALTRQVERLNRGMEHRPFNPRSGEYSAFLRGLLSTIEQLVATEPALRLEKEKTILLERLEEAR